MVVLGVKHAAAADQQKPKASLFKQRMMGVAGQAAQASSGTAAVSPACNTPTNGNSTPSKSKLGTVSFYSNVTNAASPRFNLFSPGHQSQPVVEVEDGLEVPYDAWWRRMQQESKTPSKSPALGGAIPREKSSILQALKSSGIGLFSNSPTPSAPAPPASGVPDGPRCGLLQVALEGLTVERHRKLLMVSVTVTVPTLKRAIERLNGGAAAWASERKDLVDEYLDLVHREEGEEEGEDSDDDIDDDLDFGEGEDNLGDDDDLEGMMKDMEIRDA